MHTDIISSIVTMSLRNRLLVVFIVLLVGAFGVRAMKSLPIDAVPDVTNVQVQVMTSAPSLGPLEVERFITVPVETAMSGLPRLEEVRSISRFGLSVVTVVFEEGTDIYRARQLIDERLSSARESIPEGYGSPEMGPTSTGLGEIYQFEVRGDPSCPTDSPEAARGGCWTPMELRSVLEWDVAFQLRSVPGVVEINSFGGELKTYEVQVDPDRSLALRIGLDRVIEALAQNNGNAGGAYIAHAGEQRLIRGIGLVETISDIEEIVVASRRDGTPIRIADIGEVKIAAQVRQGAVTRDGRGDVVTGIVMMQMGENSREVSRAVDERIQEIRSSLPKGVTIETFYDRTDLVDRTIRTVAINLFEGGVLVIVVLLLLLGNLRGGLLVASVIPLAMLCTFIVMKALEIPGNLMSLGALDFGLIVDGAVVMVENCVRTLAVEKTAPKDVASAVRRASLKVARPVVFAVGIIIVVYIPVLTLQGIEGKMFRPMALTVIFALAASLVLALTLMPVAATVLFKRGVRERETWLVRAADRLYTPLLARSMKHPRVTLMIAGGVFAASLSLTPLLGAEFIPRLDEGSIAMQAVRLPSVSLEESIATTTRIERELLDHFPDEVETVVSRTGRAEIATDPMGVEMSDIYIILKDPSGWKIGSKSELVAAMAAIMEEDFPGQRFTFSQPIELRTNELISGVRSDVAINIYGDDADDLSRVSARIVESIAKIPGAADVSAEQVAGLPFLNIEVDRRALARHGANARDVLDAVSAMGGAKVGEVYEGQRRFALQVRFAERFREDFAAIRRIPISTSQGAVVPLGQLAKIELEDGPASVNRHNVRRRTVVQANVRGRDLAGFVQEAQALLDDELELPAGYYLTWGGQFENLKKALDRLAFAVPSALLLILVLLYVNYGSLRPALIIYLNIPLAASGGLFALVLLGMPFSVSAGVGFIALFGIAVLNGVVMISHIRDLEAEVGVTQAVVRGARDRLRPVMMTAMSALFGFVPMAMATSAGAEVQRPLATVVIGGLLTSTALTLLVLPTVYASLFRRTREPRT